MRYVCRKMHDIWRKRKLASCFAMAILALSQMLCDRLVADDTVSIEVSVQIQPACLLNNPTYSADLGQIQTAGSQVIGFGIDCNAPFQYSLQSREGGLRNNQNGATVRPGFISLIPYTLRIAIPTDAGGISDVCDSSQLSGSSPSCPFTNSGNGIAIAQTGSMTFSWSTDKILVAGPYSDVVTLTIQPIF